MVAFYEHYSDNARVTWNNVLRDADAAESCASWVDWYGEVVCEVERLVHLTGTETLDPSESSSFSIHVADSASHFRGPSRSRSITHPTPGQALSGSPRTAILYASVQSTNFRQLHSHLLRVSGAPTPRVRYIFRPIPVDGVVGGKGYMSGYGVTLDLKKMDYLALDDRRSNSRNPLTGRDSS
ncbi:hypothetical protein EI94DRAFT_1710207 [Lactarius quietus]|nr:hypothetical protein EI94DRAFT_1710207 [Lactarius quietus]